MNEKIGIGNLNEIATAIFSFDEAHEVPIGKKLGEQWSEADKWKGIWNTTQGHLATITSSKYRIIQHRDVINAVVQELGSLGVEVQGLIKNYNDVIIADLVFQNKGTPVKDDASGIQLGMRVMNSYNKASSFRLEMFGYRMICANGMALGNTMGVREITFHTGEEKTRETIAETVREFITNVINSSDKLQKYVSETMADTMVWKDVELVLGNLLYARKHMKGIIAKLKVGQPTTRWELYNAITAYITHTEKLGKGAVAYLEKKSQKVLVTKSEQLVPAVVPSA